MPRAEAARCEPGRGCACSPWGASRTTRDSRRWCGRGGRHGTAAARGGRRGRGAPGARSDGRRSRRPRIASSCWATCRRRHALPPARLVRRAALSLARAHRGVRLVLVEAMRYGRTRSSRAASPGSGVTWIAREGQNAMTASRSRTWPRGASAIAALAARPGAAPPARTPRARALPARVRHPQVARRIEGVYATALTARGADTLQLADGRSIPAATRTRPPGDAASSRRGAGRLLVVIPALERGRRHRRRHPPGARARRDRRAGGGRRQHGRRPPPSRCRMRRPAREGPLWQGAWGAIQTGIRYAVRHGYEAVVTMDADGQHEPAYLPQLVEADASAANVVIAACPSRGSRCATSRGRYFRFLTGFELRRPHLGLPLLRRATRYALLARQEATLLDYQDVGVLLLLAARAIPDRRDLRGDEPAPSAAPRASSSPGGPSHDT